MSPLKIKWINGTYLQQIELDTVNTSEPQICSISHWADQLWMRTVTQGRYCISSIPKVEWYYGVNKSESIAHNKCVDSV